MEYSVGCIANLITGNNTLNKLKKKSTKDLGRSKGEILPTTPSTPIRIRKKIKKTEKSSKGRSLVDKLPHQNPSINRVRKELRKTGKSSKPTSCEDKPLHENPEEVQARTVFVGNVPFGISKKKFLRHFKKYGIVESVRFRGTPEKNPHIPKGMLRTVAKESLPNRTSCFGFVSFVNEEDALKAEQGNGTLFEGHHLNIHLCSKKDIPYDEDKSIFVGNLSFDAEDDDLWEVFEQCGEISRVRIVRDKVTGCGKGFAYVNFKDSDAVQLALEMEYVKIRNREIRIKISNPRASEKRDKEKGLKVKKQDLKKKNKKKLKINKSLIKNIKNIAPRAK